MGNERNAYFHGFFDFSGPASYTPSMSASQATNRQRIVTGGGQALGELMGLRVISAGTHEKPPGLYNRRQRRVLDSHAIVYLVAGGGLFETGASARLAVTSGMLLFLIPGVWHSYGPPRDMQWREYWFMFDGWLPDRLVDRRVIDPAHPLRRPGIRQDWLQRWERAFAEWETGDLIDEAALTSDLYAILAQALVSPHDAVGQQPAEPVETMKAFLAARMHDPAVDLEAMAARVGLSYSYARALFKAQTGQAPNQYLIALKLRRAKELLLATDRRIHCIAESVGYDDPYYFSRLFKKRERLSPERFRARFKPWIDEG